MRGVIGLSLAAVALLAAVAGLWCFVSPALVEFTGVSETVAGGPWCW